ncbi:MAG: hypothetical protein J2P36_32670 [Ktedonobacteraceae bacterium]|nr:hypothetical protein [Ktedonobacteraceae bacterium]
MAVDRGDTPHTPTSYGGHEYGLATMVRDQQRDAGNDNAHTAGFEPRGSATTGDQASGQRSDQEGTHPLWLQVGAATLAGSALLTGCKDVQIDTGQGGSHSGQGSHSGIAGEIHDIFGPYGSQAVRVATCESSLNSRARSEIPVVLHKGPAAGIRQHAEGIFQFIETTWNGTTQGREHPVTPGTSDRASDPRYNAEDSIKAAWEVFRRDGHSWSEWACKP